MFTALSGDEHVEQSADLLALLAALAEIQGPDVDEDCAVWQGGRLVVVRHSDGRLTWLRPEYRQGESAALPAA
jgi:hypothetical protein